MQFFNFFLTLRLVIRHVKAEAEEFEKMHIYTGSDLYHVLIGWRFWSYKSNETFPPEHYFSSLVISYIQMLVAQLNIETDKKQGAIKNAASNRISTRFSQQ